MPVEREHLDRMRELVARTLGLELGGEAADVLSHALAQRVAERRTTTAAYLDMLASEDVRELHALGQLLTVGETYFFRMRGHFDALRALATEREGAPLAVLSAACSTGEEAYSIAMTLVSIGRKDARVTAVDLSRRSLDAARLAVYSDWSLRAVAQADRERWFTKKGRSWEVRSDVRAMVDLRPANLVEGDAIPLGPFDAIFCRNVLMYFTRDAARTVVARLTASLRSGGLLFLGHAETLRGISEEYIVEPYGDSFHYRHIGSSVAPAPISVRTATPPKWMAPPPQPLAAATPHLIALLAEARFGDALQAMDPAPTVLRALALFGGGFDREGLLAATRAELAALPHRPEAGEKAAVVRGALATQKVLVVGRGLEETIAALRREAFDVATADSTADALVLLEHTTPSCVVLAGSIDDCRALRAAALRPTALLALTALTGEEDSALAVAYLGAGVDEVASRAMPGELLVARVRAQIRRTQEVERKNAELEVASGELEAFSYTVSHDLRAPLRAIQGFARALEEDEGDRLGEDGKGHLGRIIGATNRMNELIEDLLGLSRVSRAEIAARDVDLGEIARAVVADLRARSPERAVEVIVADGLTARGDASLLRAVLENLVGNAWKFTSRKVAAVRIEVGGAEREGERAFFVADNGAGFDMTQAERLFRPLQRLHSPKDFEGTGIGLATVRRIIVRHGGRVWAESAKGEGARFWFTLG